MIRKLRSGEYRLYSRKTDPKTGKARDITNRTSYVIGRDGKIKFVHSDLSYVDHVKLTLEAVKALK